MKERKKVGIMTWYTYRNYGTALQVSALSHVINKLGYCNEVISYLPRNRVEAPPKITLILLIKKIIIKLLKKGRNPYTSIQQENLYETYYKTRIYESVKCRTYSELHDLNEKYGAFICGSDQIWSPLCFDEMYFLSFVDETERMISYAPSIGSFEIKNSQIKERMRKLISRFHYLSIREQQGAEIIKSLTGKEAKVVLDPTLLMNADEWSSYAETNSCMQIKSRYIICYFLGKADKYMTYVHKLSQKLKIPFYVIPVTMKQKKSKNTIPFEVGPSEFVSLIKNASFVCTDSFHGMAFSINFNTPFVVFKRFKDNDLLNQNSRILSLLDLLNLKERLVDYDKLRSVEKVLSCDFTYANQCMNTMRKESMEYLSHSLEMATGYSEKDKAFKITDRCCGCGACSSVCRQKAIKIQKNEEGFYQYSIDTSLCVHCGQCKLVCPMTHIIAPELKDAYALYSMKSTSETVMKKSSSGGIGYELAKKCLENGMMVCGCMYDRSKNLARHIMIEENDFDKLSLLQGSKYIQSNTKDTMEIINKLEKSQKIAFFGTPCQAAAVDKLLRKNGMRENAIIIDLICHGVPTAYLWDKFLCDIDKKYKTGTNPNVLFRSKELEWRRRLMMIEGNGHIYKQEEIRDDFYAFFRRGLCYMESCSDCPYREKSAADIRIGDYWGTKFEHDKQGVSMVIANTENGQNMLTKLVENKKCNWEKQDLEEYWSVQYPYNHLKPLIRENLIADLKVENISLHEIRKEYCENYDKYERFSKLKNKVKHVFKRK